MEIPYCVYADLFAVLNNNLKKLWSHAVVENLILELGLSDEQIARIAEHHAFNARSITRQFYYWYILSILQQATSFNYNQTQ